MPPSQLKKLKLSLKEQSLAGPQQSKKKKSRSAHDGFDRDSNTKRRYTLQGIRDQFNPFEVRPVEKKKFDVTKYGAPERQGSHRPGATKGFGEETRRKTLYVEMQRRKKIGGITDRRFGEDNPEMTPEQKALQRYVRERERGSQKSAIFDLEDLETDGNLTHLGRSLSLRPVHGSGDFEGDGLLNQELGAQTGMVETRSSKRRRLSSSGNESEIDTSQDSDRGGRTRSKKEVMEEVIARSKLQKYERQKNKEDDDELRAELDKGFSDVYSILRGNQSADLRALSRDERREAHGSVNPDRLAMIEGKDRLQADKEYDERLRQMIIDQRARPTLPALTEEERLEREAQRIRDLEEHRLRRMRGESEDTEPVTSEDKIHAKSDTGSDAGSMDTFGLGSGLQTELQNRELDVEDEDHFLIDEDLVSIASSIDSDLSKGRGTLSSLSSADDDDFNAEPHSSDRATKSNVAEVLEKPQPKQNLQQLSSSIYSCPESLEDLLEITGAVDDENLPIIVQRIRAIYHPKLASENKAKLGAFAGVLVEYLYHLANQTKRPSFTILETLTRHLHSLAKSFSEEVGRAFRSHLRIIQEERAAELNPGDLIIFIAIGSIFPTSDHFHQVVTPAMLCMSRYLSQNVPLKLTDLAMSTFVSILCLQYQQITKRYVPEVPKYVMKVITALLPLERNSIEMKSAGSSTPGVFHLQGDDGTIRAAHMSLSFQDTSSSPSEDEVSEELRQVLFCTQIKLIHTMASLWESKSAFCEILAPFHQRLCLLSTKPYNERIPIDIQQLVRDTAATLHLQLQSALRERKPLRLHHHRPLPIKTSIPRFDESFNPDKHNDPDADRAELSKLKAQHKKERKGALRELRKDTKFMAREDLREKKERDAAYERKFKRLAAEIQGEEGREGKLYDREKRMRKSKR